MAERKRSSRSAGARNSGGNAGCLVWLALLCLVFLLFVLKWGDIQETLRSTNFTEVVKTQRAKEPEGSSPPVVHAPPVPEPLPGDATTNTLPGNRETQPLTVPSEETAAGSSSPVTTPTKPEQAPAAPQTPRVAEPVPPAREKPAATAPRPGSSSPQTRPTGSTPPATRTVQLFFVRIDDDGIIVRQEVSRAVPSTDSPLTDALGALLRGPSEGELRKNLLSLVPVGTVLLSAQVRGSTAFLNFSEAFMYNHYGIEGYAGQLKQIVYTATAFPTVHDVQILIEGERHDYLGGEGVYIGRPLSRNSF